MKKLLSLAFFGLFLAALSVASVEAYADTPAATQPGCAPEVMTAQQNHVAALEVRDKAIERQIVKQNDNSLGMTCYDHALGLTARLGQIFSDTYPPNDFPAANTAVFSTLYDPASGGGKLLGQDITDAVSGVLSSHADDFTDSLSSFLGATNINFSNGGFTQITDFISSITSMITSINAAIGSIDSAMNTLFTVFDLLGSVLPTIIPPTVIAIKQAWKQIKTVLTQAVQAVQKLIRDAIKTVSDYINNELGNLLGTTNDSSTGDCSRIQQLYNPGVAPQIDGFRSILGSGLEQGTPYQTFAELLNKGATTIPNFSVNGVNLGTVTTMIAGGTDFTQELNNATNSPILQTALQDITGSGILTGAQNFLTTVNKVPAPDAMPTFSAGATMAAIRSKM